jgi:hypothetical protein
MQKVLITLYMGEYLVYMNTDNYSATHYVVYTL